VTAKGVHDHGHPDRGRIPTVPGAGKLSDLHGREHHAGALTSLFPGVGNFSPLPAKPRTIRPTSFVVGHPDRV
jgi:hypothetical protein